MTKELIIKFDEIAQDLTEEEMENIAIHIDHTDIPVLLARDGVYGWHMSIESDFNKERLIELAKFYHQRPKADINTIDFDSIRNGKEIMLTEFLKAKDKAEKEGTITFKKL